MTSSVKSAFCRTVMQRSISTLVLLSLASLVVGCGDDDNGSGDSGDAPGEACAVDYPCMMDSTLCFAVGFPSSCRNGGLCVGDGAALACAMPCDSDAECATGEVCFLDCEEPLFNGHCVHPYAREGLLSFPFCMTPGERRGGVAGALP